MMQRVFEEIEDLQSSSLVTNEQDNISQHKDSILVQINLFG